MSENITFPVVSFRHLETPFQKLGYRNYYAVIDVSKLPDLSNWRKINVRDPKLKGSVPRAITEGFLDKAELFLFMNRGIVLAVESVKYDNQTSKLTVKLSDPKLHGLLDGGHTYTIIDRERKNLDRPAFVKVEILEGFEARDEITDVVDARNTSNQVKDESLMNLAGEFDLLRKALKGAPYLSKIAFKEFETDDDGDPKPIDIREVIAILTAFDAEHFNDAIHPINTYRSKAACVRHFGEHSESYKKIYPLAKELLELHDHIYDKLPGLYNEVRGVTGNVSGGKFGKLTGVAMYDDSRSIELHFLGKRTRYGVPAGFVLPILGAFRAFLEEENGRYIWGKDIDPLELLQGGLGQKLADTIGNFALDAQNPSKTGKSPLVWQACYQSAQVHYLRMK